VRDWRIHVEPVELAGIRSWLLSSALSPLTSRVTLTHLLTVHAKVQGKAAKTKAQKMDHSSRGCHFFRASEGEHTTTLRLNHNHNNDDDDDFAAFAQASAPGRHKQKRTHPRRREKLTVKTKAKRSTTVVQLALTRRLATDVVDAETLGVADISLRDIPVYPFSQRRTPGSCAERVVSFRQRSRSKRPNGNLTLRVWMQPEHTELPLILVALFRAPPLTVASLFAVAVAGCLRLLRVVDRLWVALVFVAPVILCVVGVELPSLTGRLLTEIVAWTCPGLGLKFGAIRFFLYLVRKQDNVQKKTQQPRELVFSVDVDDFRLVNDPSAGYFHDDFVRASTIRFSVVLDLALLQRTVDVAAILLKRWIFRKTWSLRERPFVAHERGSHPTHLRLAKLRLELDEDAAAAKGLFDDGTKIAQQQGPLRLKLIGVRGSLPTEQDRPEGPQHHRRQQVQLRALEQTEAAWPKRLRQRGRIPPSSPRKMLARRLQTFLSQQRVGEPPAHSAVSSFRNLDVDYVDLVDTSDGAVKFACESSLGLLVAASRVLRLPLDGGQHDIDIPLYAAKKAATTPWSFIKGPGRNSNNNDSDNKNDKNDDDDPQRGRQECRIVGWIRARVLMVVKPLAQHAINWSPFPSMHAALRAEDPFEFEPTRLATLVVRELCVENVSLAFDIASGEFNVNRLNRKVADGKVRAALPRRFRDHPPNTLRVRVLAATGVPGNKILRVKVSVRGVAIKSNSQKCYEGSCVWNHSMTFPCPDASATCLVQVYEDASFGKLVGQWMTTAKMLVLDRSNVFGRDLDGDDRPHVVDGEAHCSFRLRGAMALRDRRWLPINTSEGRHDQENGHRDVATEPPPPLGLGGGGGGHNAYDSDDSDEVITSSSSSAKNAGTLSPRSSRVASQARCASPSRRSPEIELEVSWYHDPKGGLSQDEILAFKPLTALEQLQQNSLETSQKLGNLALVDRMLADFPLLFDVRSLEISHINCYLKPLFAGYRGQGDHQAEQDDDLDDDDDDGVDDGPPPPPREERNAAAADDAAAAAKERSVRKRGAIYVGKIDLRDALTRGGDGSFGVDLSQLTRSLVSSLVKPVLSEVSLYTAGKHILSGLYVGMFSSKKAVRFGGEDGDVDDGDDSDDDAGGDSPGGAPLVRHGRESLERYKFVVDAFRADTRKYLSWQDQVDLLAPPAIKGLLLRKHVSSSRLLRAAAAALTSSAQQRHGRGEHLLLDNSTRSDFLDSSTSSRTTRRTTRGGRSNESMSLVWCEIHGFHLYYSKVQPNGQSRVGFTKLVDLRPADVGIGRGDDGELIVRYARGSAQRHVAFLPFSSREPSTDDWYDALRHARETWKDTVVPPVSAVVADDSLVQAAAPSYYCLETLLDTKLFCGLLDGGAASTVSPSSEQNDTVSVAQEDEVAQEDDGHEDLSHRALFFDHDDDERR